MPDSLRPDGGNASSRAAEHEGWACFHQRFGGNGSGQEEHEDSKGANHSPESYRRVLVTPVRIRTQPYKNIAKN
jgi:hypothetical protein